MGAGSTGIAALAEGRRFIGIEIDEHWFNVACERLREFDEQPDLFAPRPAKPEAWAQQSFDAYNDGWADAEVNSKGCWEDAITALRVKVAE
jgi:DNA modification methylase